MSDIGLYISTKYQRRNGTAIYLEKLLQRNSNMNKFLYKRHYNFGKKVYNIYMFPLT